MAKHRHSKKRSYRRRSSKKMMMGGDVGAAEHGVNTYGGIGQQHAVSGVDNTIAMNSHMGPVVITGGSPLAPTEYVGGADMLPKLYGGTHLPNVPIVPMSHTVGGDGETEAEMETDMKPEVEGGGIITDIAVPAVLLYARNSLQKHRLVGMPNMGKTMRKGRGRRFKRRGSRRGRR